MNFLHKVFHLEKDLNRKFYANEINNYLNEYSDELDSEAIEISNDDQLANFYSKYPKFNINKKIGFRYGEVGVWASNYAAWKKFDESGCDYLILMEDDISFEKDFFNLLNLYMKDLPQNWDIFFFGCANNGSSFYNEEEHGIGSPYVCKAWQGNWLLCYVINKKSVKKIIKSVEQEVVERPIDIHLFYSPQHFNIYTLMPHAKHGVHGVELGTTIHHQKRIGE
jgi:GR25 family glycosyltransferase involved in LPS biosynthesis